MSCGGTELLTIRFQQDGVTAHTAKAPMEVIQEMFLEHVISLRGEHYSLYIRLIPLPVIISFGRTSKQKCRPLHHETLTTIWKQISAIPENVER